MQPVLRAYVTSGIALVGAGLIAFTPVPSPPSGVQVRPVQLVANPYTDLFNDTVANLQNIAQGADPQAISTVIGEFFTNPLGVISVLTNLTPDVTTDLSSLPAQVSVELPPGLALVIANLAANGATLNAIHDVVAQLTSDPSSAVTTLINAPAIILNAFLNGQDNISLLGGIINIPIWNGVLAPEQSLDVDLNLTKLLDALGLGNLDLSNLDLTNLLNQLGLGNLTLGGLLSDLGISDDGLGDLLGNPTLGDVLSDFGLGDLGLGSLSLTNVLSGLGLDTNVDLNNLSLDSVLQAFGINPNVDIGLSALLSNLGFSSLVNESLGTLLSDTGLLSPVLNALNSTIQGILSAIPGVGALLGPLLDNLLTSGDLEDALNSLTVGDLLGGQTLDESLSDVLQALGVNDVTPSDLTVGSLLQALGFAPSTGNLTLSDLLGGLGNGILGLNVGSLLNSLNLGELMNMLGLSSLDLNLGDLVGDLSHLDLDGLLGDLGLSDLDLANISVDPFGGLITELVDTVPQQILDALGS